MQDILLFVFSAMITAAALCIWSNYKFSRALTSRRFHEDYFFGMPAPEFIARLEKSANEGHYPDRLIRKLRAMNNTLLVNMFLMPVFIAVALITTSFVDPIERQALMYFTAALVSMICMISSVATFSKLQKEDTPAITFFKTVKPKDRDRPTALHIVALARDASSQRCINNIKDFIKENKTAKIECMLYRGVVSEAGEIVKDFLKRRKETSSNSVGLKVDENGRVDFSGLEGLNIPEELKAQIREEVQAAQDEITAKNNTSDDKPLH